MAIVYAYKYMVQMETFIEKSNKESYISAIQNLAFNLPLVIILGTYNCEINPRKRL